MILVVDDDPKIRTLLRNVLEVEGFDVLEAATSDEVMSALAEKPIALITLDIYLGNDNGLELAKTIRRVSSVPIIMVTGQDDVIDRVVGLEIGADDYITKPFHVREVIARVRNILRRTGQRHPRQDASSNGNSVSFDGLTANLDKMELLDRKGRNCGLTSGDFKLLSVFLDRPQRVLSRDQLMDFIGGVERSPLDRTIDNQVARLRKKIERNPSDPALIKTVRGIGYKFVGDVDSVQVSDPSSQSD